VPNPRVAAQTAAAADSREESVDEIRRIWFPFVPSNAPHEIHLQRRAVPCRAHSSSVAAATDYVGYEMVNAVMPIW
jgi:hypothetical protein